MGFSDMPFSKLDSQLPSQLPAGLEEAESWMDGCFENCPSPDPGERFQDLHFHGEGASAVVYRAFDGLLNRRVALKFLKPGLFRKEAILREARAQASLEHPNICRIYEILEIKGQTFLVMQWIDSLPLSHLAGRMDVKRSMELIRDVALGIHSAHEQGLIHLDLKPGNILTQMGEKGQITPFITDFGMVRREGSLDSEPCPKGTPPYSSPEQLRGGASIDRRSDLYSLGVLLYVLLTGRYPFGASKEGPSSTKPIRKLRQDLPKAPRELEHLLERCLQESPENRWPDARSLAQEMDRILARLSHRSWFQKGLQLLAHPKEWFQSRAGLGLALGALFLFNYLETTLERWIRDSLGLGKGWSLHLAEASHRLEGSLSFLGQDASTSLAVVGFSLSYFLLFPFLFVLPLLALARRKALAPFRTAVRGVLLSYALALPFFLLYPVPERWSFPASEAILLSDLWTSRWIEIIRPFSGLEHCFPSLHTALSTLSAIWAFHYRLSGRWLILPLAMTVLLATFALGIHWTTDILAGVGLAFLAHGLAIQWEGCAPKGDPVTFEAQSE